MASNANVQFWGADSVLAAFDNRDLPGWAIFQGKCLIGSGVSRPELVSFIQLIANSTGIYTLKVYDTDNADDIDDQTAARGSFNFKLLENPGFGAVRPLAVAGAGGSGSGGIAGIIQSRIENKLAGKIDKMLDRLDDDDEDDEPETIGSIINGYLSDPEKLIPVLGAIKNIFSNTGNSGGGIAYAPPAQIAQPLAAVGAPITSMEEKYSRIGNAVETLEKSDPDIVQHLETLAALSISNPQKFRGLISMLAML